MSRRERITPRWVAGRLGAGVMIAAAGYGLIELGSNTYEDRQDERATREAVQEQQRDNREIINSTNPGQNAHLTNISGGYFVTIPRIITDPAIFLALETDGDTYALLESADCVYKIAVEQGKLEAESGGIQKTNLKIDALDVLVQQRGVGLPAVIGRVDKIKVGDIFEVCPKNRTFDFDIPDWVLDRLPGIGD